MSLHGHEVWYDYFSCPQPAAHKMSLVKSIVTNPCEDLRRSIASIPAYVAKCQWFVALCPALRSEDDSSDLNQSLGAGLWRWLFFFGCASSKTKFNDISYMLSSRSLSQKRYTWANRGWCRAEKMARELSDRHGLVLMVDSPEHLTLLPVPRFC